MNVSNINRILDAAQTGDTLSAMWEHPQAEDGTTNPLTYLTGPIVRSGDIIAISGPETPVLIRMVNRTLIGHLSHVSLEVKCDG